MAWCLTVPSYYITWSSVDLSLMDFCDTHLRSISKIGLMLRECWKYQFAKSVWTRSTPRAQPPAAPSLKSMKQYSSVKQSSLLPLVSISWKFHECPSIRYSVMLRTYTDPEYRNPCIQGVKPIIPTTFQIAPFVITDKSWKFHENVLMDFTARCVLMGYRETS